MEIRKHVNFSGGIQIQPIPARRKSIVNRRFVETLLTVEQRLGWLNTWRQTVGWISLLLILNTEVKESKTPNNHVSETQSSAEEGCQ
jgi:hypothetical protein